MATDTGPVDFSRGRSLFVRPIVVGYTATFSIHHRVPDENTLIDILKNVLRETCMRVSSRLAKFCCRLNHIIRLDTSDDRLPHKPAVAQG